MRRASARREISILLDLLDEAYTRRAWHGPNLRGTLRGVTAEQAAWRPAESRHSIWEIVVHAAYWKYAVRRRLTGEKRGSFSLQGSNWFRRPLDASERAWRADIALLEAEHRRLRAVVEGFPPDALHRTSGGSIYTHARLIYGIASHDLYHAGQIQLLKRLMRK